MSKTCDFCPSRKKKILSKITYGLWWFYPIKCIPRNNYSYAEREINYSMCDKCIENKIHIKGWESNEWSYLRKKMMKLRRAEDKNESKRFI